jgi:hypothetical protein
MLVSLVVTVAPVATAPAAATVPELAASHLDTNLPAPDGWGGRALAASVDPFDTAHALVASESGGLWVTANDGGHWSRVSSLPPFRLSDVRFSPDVQDLVLVTARGDLGQQNGGGVWRSTNGGVTWTHSVDAIPATAGGCPQASAWGIGWTTGGSVAVATDCGIAVSTDQGATWTTSNLAAPAYSVLTRPGATGLVIDVCGADGTYRKVGTGGLLIRAGPPCQFAQEHALAGPDDTRVVFTATYDADGMNTDIEESDDRGGTYHMVGQDPHGGGRLPVVALTPSRDGVSGHYDLWYSSGYFVAEVTCTGTAATHVCPTSLSASNHRNIEHSDVNDVTFSGPGCVRYVSDDGGIEGSHDCGATFRIEGAGTHGYDALQVYNVSGRSRVDGSDLFFGTQDNATWASNDSGASWPGVVPGRNPQGLIASDGPLVQAPETVTGPYSNLVTVSDTSAGYQATNPTFAPGSTTNWQFAPGQTASSPPYVLNAGVYVEWGTPGNTLWLTTDAGGTWHSLTQIPQTPVWEPAVHGNAVLGDVYQAVDRGSGRVGLVHISWTGTGPASVQAADTGLNNLRNPALPFLAAYADGDGTFNLPVVFALDPTDPTHVIAADLGASKMVQTNNGGASWTPDAALTSLMTAHSKVFSNNQGAEPHVIAFDPANSGHVYVGTESNGVAYSADAGHTWGLIPASLPITAATGFFFDTNRNRVIVSSYGRGLWVVYPPEHPSRVLVCPDPCNHEATHGYFSPADTLDPGALQAAEARVVDANGKAVPDTPIWASFTAAPGGGSLTINGKPVGSTSQQFVTDASGLLSIDYTAPAKLPTAGSDMLTIQDAQKAPLNRSTLTYDFDQPTSYQAAPSPIAKTASLNIGDHVPVQVSVRDATKGAVSGAAVWVWFAKHGAAGYADVDGTAITSKPTEFETTAAGTMTVNYRSGFPRPGTDSLIVADAPQTPAHMVTLTYTG